MGSRGRWKLAALGRDAGERAVDGGGLDELAITVTPFGRLDARLAASSTGTGRT
jgi:hypothetical protein